MRLSIVIPAYNVEKYIKKTLYSLISQTEKNFEVIVVNDGSTDNTYNIVESIISENYLTNFKIINKKNNGVSSARNTGIKKASGDYLIFLDGDDFVENDLVETISDVLKEQTPDLICWGYSMINEDHKIILNYADDLNSNTIKMTGSFALQRLLIERSLSIWTGSIAYRKKFLYDNNLKYTEGCSSGEDHEFIYKSLARTNNVVSINRILSYYLQREGSITHSYDIKRFDAINAMTRACDYILNLNDKTLDKVANTIRNEKIIENYFYNYSSCAGYLFIKEKLSIREAIVYINSQIEKDYPGLIDMIKSTKKYYTGKDKKTLLHLNLFFNVPWLYYCLVKGKKKIKAYKLLG